MSALYDKITAAIKDAMIAKDTVKRDCLRSLVSEVKNQTVNAGKELTEEIVIKCIQKAVKSHNDSISQFREAKREDLAAKEEAELNVLSEYLPKMLSEEMTQALILKIINENSIPEVKKSMGIIMKKLNEVPEKSQIDRKIASQYLNMLLK